MRNSARFEKVKPILHRYISLYNETRSISFSTVEQDRIKLGNNKRIGKVVKAIGVAWILLFISMMLYFVSDNSFIRLSLLWVLPIILLLFLFLILNIKLTKNISEIMIHNSEVEIVLLNKNNDLNKTFTYSIFDMEFRSRISKNSDAVRSYFSLWIFSLSGKIHFNIDVSDKYDEYLAFMIALRLIKNREDPSNIPDYTYDKYIDNVLFGKRLV